MEKNLRELNFLEAAGEEDEGVDLALSLSIGGSYRKAATASKSSQGSDSMTRSGELVSDLAEKDLSKPPARCETCSFDDRMLLEAKMLQSRVKDRAAKEKEGWSGRRNKEQTQDLAPKPNPNPSPSPNPNFVPYGVHAFPVIPMQYTYNHVQYVPFLNGFGFPYMMPCWAPIGSSAANGLNYLEAFRNSQFPEPSLSSRSNITGCCKSDIGVKPILSAVSGSNGSSSSAISEFDSDSVTGGSSSSDMGSHSSQASVEKPQTQCHQKEEPSSQILEEGADKEFNSIAAQSSSKLDPFPVKSNPKKLERATSINKPVFATEEEKKPRDSPSQLHMPCVSTTGNGPNGKTILGLLHRYINTEVDIECVCHGSSFSPAEFVKHAGGTYTTHPLSNIFVVPS